MCKYKDILGKVGEGVHSYRFLNIALVDVLATIFVAYLIHRFTKMKFSISLILLFLLGIVCHRIFCVPTTIDKLLFPQMIIHP